MATLHGVLAELGIESPFMHPERQVPGSQHTGEREAAAQAPHSQWVVDQAFQPMEGRSYEIAYGAIPEGPEGKRRHVIKRIRVDGPDPGRWFDLGAGHPLDPTLHAYPVRAFRPLDAH